jgi:hypothetical protein
VDPPCAPLSKADALGGLNGPEDYHPRMRRYGPGLAIAALAALIILYLVLTGQGGRQGQSPSPTSSATASSTASASPAETTPGETPAVTPPEEATATEVAAPAPSLPQGDEPVELDPADFTGPIDNPYWPMAVGSRWVYNETDGDGTEVVVEVTVTDETKKILGIDAAVVHDVVTEDGEVKEDTLDWYAQDDDGNIWYLGEETKEYEGGEVVSTEGSWEAGVDGAQPGVIMPADPVVGLVYRQEYLEGEAEDSAEVLSLDEHVEVPFGTFDNVLQTKDYTPLEPGLVEHKFYAQGVGPVLAEIVSGGSGREELVEFTIGP